MNDDATRAHGANYTLKDEIRAYWSQRAASFDSQVGHAFRSPAELTAMQAFLRRSLGAEPLTVLDLACGTGEVSRALLGLGHSVTGIDFSDDMLALARAKLGRQARFVTCDAERLLEDDASYDALVTRHLVWTLTDPQAAFAEWFRVLKPGGRLLIVDGNWMTRTWLQRLMHKAGSLLAPKGDEHVRDRESFDSIARRFHFRDGLTFERLAAMLREAGFARIETANYTPVLRAMQRNAPLADALRIGAATRFALLATKA